MKTTVSSVPVQCGYDAAMANRLASIMAECATDDDVLDFNDLINPSTLSNKSWPFLDSMMRPDLGIEFVNRVDDFKLLSILSDQRLRWLKVAASTTRTSLPNGWKRPSGSEQQAVAWAISLASDPNSKAYAELVNACLLCGSSTIADVAELLHLQADHLEAYHDLYFNVLSRRSERAYINLIAYPGRGSCLPTGLHSDHPSRPLLALAARCDNLPMLCRYLGWSDAADSMTSLREASQSALLMLVNELPGKIISMGGDPQFSPKLFLEALRSARSTVGLETTSDALTYGDDEFSKFAEGLLADDVKELQNRIDQKMEQQRASS